MSTVPEHLEKLDKLFKPLEAEAKAMYDNGHFVDDIVEEKVIAINLAIQDAKQTVPQKVKENQNGLS